ncbi:hypothetical protein LTR66_006860 [Elasticomyces elasticus]|nr:hypothetical protein LTR66_006860 [Elasticomyces elasticus]
MFMPGPRKSAQRTNSSSSITSSASSNSTINISSVQANGTSTAPDSWAARKRPTKNLWPTGKAEPVAGISTARPQLVSTASSGTSATSAMTALHAPLLPSQQMANGQSQQVGTLRVANAPEQTALLHLSPMNGTFERKTITVPFYPDVLRIGRQTNQKTIPTPSNGYFDSKVLSRSHAEVYADRNGRIFIRDVKSSNGTFVNGSRLSPENKESEPHELRESDLLELGIDIVSEDQKTVVHHKVSAKVEHAGIFSQTGDFNFQDLDPSAGNGAQQLKRSASQGSMNGGRTSSVAGSIASNNTSGAQHPKHWGSWLQPFTIESVAKKLDNELKLAQRQSQEICRAQQYIDSLFANDPKQAKEELNTKSFSSSEKPTRPSPVKTKAAHFSDPPAPPPQQPLPEKPDVAKALADPIIAPLLRRSDTARPQLGSTNASPTRMMNDYGSQLIILTEELKSAKDRISSQDVRVKTLEDELKQERNERERAEERAMKAETSRKDSVESKILDPGDVADDTMGTTSSESDRSPTDSASSVQSMPTDADSTKLLEEVERLKTQMAEMNKFMDQYRQRAEKAEADCKEAKQSLLDMIEDKRRQKVDSVRSRSRSASDSKQQTRGHPGSEQESTGLNGHAVTPVSDSPTLLKRAGVEVGQPITEEQVAALQRLLTGSRPLQTPEKGGREQSLLAYQGRPFAIALLVVVIGYASMTYGNAWEKAVR